MFKLLASSFSLIGHGNGMGHRSHLVAGNGQHGKLTPDWKLKRDHLSWLDSQSYQIRCHPACCLIQFPVGITVTTVVDHIFPVRIRFYRPIPAVQQRFIFPVPLLPVLFCRFGLIFLSSNITCLLTSASMPSSRQTPASIRGRLLQKVGPFHPFAAALLSGPVVLCLLLCFQFFLPEPEQSQRHRPRFRNPQPQRSARSHPC